MYNEEMLFSQDINNTYENIHYLQYFKVEPISQLYILASAVNSNKLYNFMLMNIMLRDIHLVGQTCLLKSSRNAMSYQFLGDLTAVQMLIPTARLYTHSVPLEIHMVGYLSWNTTTSSQCSDFKLLCGSSNMVTSWESL